VFVFEGHFSRLEEKGFILVAVFLRHSAAKPEGLWKKGRQTKKRREERGAEERIVAQLIRKCRKQL
jgi:hypothetical protein